MKTLQCSILYMPHWVNAVIISQRETIDTEVPAKESSSQKRA